MFWAPSLTREPSTASETDSSAVNGGHTTMSTSDCLPAAWTISSARATASADVLFIFQLPAMSFFRVMVGVPFGAAGSGFEERDARKDLALQVLEAGAAARRAVGDLVRHLELRGRGGRVAAADDRGGAVGRGLGDRLGHRPRRPRELVELEDARGAVPDDRLRPAYGRVEEGDRLRAPVEAHPALGDPRGVVRRPRGGVRVEPVRADVVHGKDDRDAARLRLLDQLAHDLRPLGVEQAVADLHPAENL